MQIEDQGVDPNLKDADGATPVHFAASCGHIDALKLLLKHGGQITIDRYGKSPIDDALQNDHTEVIELDKCVI